eukprot:1151628-Pelagomonas_calceolata.AAC.7
MKISFDANAKLVQAIAHVLTYRGVRAFSVRHMLARTWRVGQAQGSHTRASLDQEGVGMAVVAAHELDDFVTLGVGTHEAEGRQACLSARAGEAHNLHRGHAFDDHAGQGVLQA